MKSWRGILTVAVLLGCLAGYALAEGDKGGPGGPGGPGGKPDKPPKGKRPEPGRIIKIALDHAADLQLTDEQKAKLEELLKNAPKKDGPPGDGQRPPKDGGGDKGGPKDGGDHAGPKDGPPDGKAPPEGKHPLEGKDGQGPPEGKKPGGGEGQKHPPKDSPLSKILTEEQMAKLKDILKAEGIGGPGGPGGDKGGDHPKGPPPGGDHPKGPPPGGDGGGK